MEETIRTGEVKEIVLPLQVDPNAAYKADLEVIRVEQVKTFTKKRQKLEESLTKGYTTVYDQCSQEVRDKLKATMDWEAVEKEQSKKICIGFNDHRQSAFNLVQSLKTLFLYTQTEKDTIEAYTRHIQSLWNTVEAVGGLPEIHVGMVKAQLTKLGITAANATQTKAAQEAVCKQVKAALLISWAD